MPRRSKSSRASALKYAQFSHDKNGRFMKKEKKVEVENDNEGDDDEEEVKLTVPAVSVEQQQDLLEEHDHEKQLTTSSKVIISTQKQELNNNNKKRKLITNDEHNIQQQHVDDNVTEKSKNITNISSVSGTTGEGTLLVEEFKVLKKFEGTIRYMLGYSGPPGTKNATTLIQESRLLRSGDELDEVCDHLVDYYFERVRGPAGKVHFTPAIQKWRNSLKDIVWENHIVVLLVHKTRRPKLESISMIGNEVARKLKIQFSIDRRAGQMQSQNGLYFAAQVKVACGADCLSGLECEFECVPGTLSESEDEIEDDVEDEKDGDEEEK